MVLKTQPLAPLETIYEESGSFIASTVNFSQEFNNETINGLISARAIPSVDLQRQRAHENDKKPPIEVRFRDGSKRYIHPSTTTTMITNRRNLLDSSEENLSSKKPFNTNSRQIFPSNINKNKFPLVVTIITADDLNQAGITPTMSSSPSESDRSTSIHSQTNSPMEKRKIIEDIHEPIVNNSSPNHPPQQQHIVTNHQNLTPSQSSSSHQSFSTSTKPSSIPSSKIYASSLQITLTKEENEKNLSLNANRTNETVNRMVQPNRKTLVEGGTHNAFRPVFKPIRFNQQPISIKSRVTSTINTRPINPSQQQQRIVPYSQFYQKEYPPKSTSNIPQISHKPISIIPKYTYDSLIPTQIEFNVATNPSSNIDSLIPMYGTNCNTNEVMDRFIRVNLSNVRQKSKAINHHFDNSSVLPGVLNFPTKPGQTLSFAVKPTMQWLNITSNSIYDIPRLSSKYARIPLRITLPVVSPTHNQNLVIRHNPALEKRLLNAGLSSETIALYERILDVADNRQMNIDQYLYKSFI